MGNITTQLLNSDEFKASLKKAILAATDIDYIYNGEDEVPTEYINVDWATTNVIEVLKKLS